MSDETPILDAVDAAFRASRQQEKPDDRTSEEREQDERRRQRINAERRLERASHEGDRKARAKAYATARRAMLNAATALKHGEKADADALAQSIASELGVSSDRARAIVRDFAKTASQHVAEGNKLDAWRAADNAAERLVLNAEWRVPAREVDDGEGLSPRELAERIGR